MAFNRGGRGRPSFGGRREFGGGSRGRGETFSATCSSCGKSCELPFRPSNGRPVYCDDCFSQNRNDTRGSRDNRGSYNQSSERAAPQERAPSADQDHMKRQMDSLNMKLDKIVKMLSLMVERTSVAEEAPVVAESEIVEEVVEKAPKKKVAKKKTEKKSE